MAFNAAAYQSRYTPVHKLDARVKFVLLVAVSVTVFAVQTWPGLLVLVACIGACCVLARVNVSLALRQLAAVGVLLAVALIGSSFTFHPVGTTLAVDAEGFVSWFGMAAPIPLAGSLAFVPAGFERGCFVVVRVVVLLAASIVVTTTTSPAQISAGLRSLLSPLARIGVPVHDVATIVSLAVRFIPVLLDQLQQTASAHTARGSALRTGGFRKRLAAWGRVFVSLFVGLFRRARDLSIAMDARCYGNGAATQLDPPITGRAEVVLLVVGIASCIALAVMF